MDTYDDLAARAERGELTIRGPVKRGQAASVAARAALVNAAGAVSEEEAVRLALEPGSEAEEER